MRKRLANQSAGLILLAALLLVLLAVLYLQHGPPGRPAPAGPEAGSSRGAGDEGPAGANSRYPFAAFPGSLRIERDLSAVSLSGGGPTALDGMDRKRLAAFRLEKVGKYRQLGFFHPGYAPFASPHDPIYARITPGADWLYSVPYYIANPYLLVILVPANHVTPIDIYLPEVDIGYRNGVLSETIRGASARRWFDAVFSSDRSGFIRLIMVNAWDAGFRYIHLDPGLSRNIKPSDNHRNVTRSWHSQHCFYHVGRYKKNNLSPEDRRGWVELRRRDEPTRLHVKLWRAKPGDIGDSPDLAFIFTIDPHA